MRHQFARRAARRSALLLFVVASVLALAVAGLPLSLRPGGAVSAAAGDAATMSQLEGTAKQHAPVFGPNSGTLQQSASSINIVRAGVTERDFYAHVRYTNPSAASQHSWDIGIGFMDRGQSNQYRLIVGSDGSWYFLWEPDQNPTSQGTLKGLKTGANQTNTLDLAVKGTKGYFAINGTYVATLDVSKHAGAGDIWIATAFFSDDTTPGKSSPYADFTVWSLGASGAGTPTAAAGTATSGGLVLGPTATATAGGLVLGPTATAAGGLVLGPTPTPARAGGVSDHHYTSPTYGFTLAWASSWSVVSSSSKGGVDKLTLTDKTSTVGFTTSTAFKGNVAQCRAALVTALRADPKNHGVTPGPGPNGQPLQGSDATRAWAVYLYRRTGSNGQTTDLARYLECRVLVPGKAVLQIVDDVPPAKFNAEAAKLQALLGALKLATAAATPAATAAPATAPVATPVAPTAPATAPAAGTPEANSGVHGRSYTSPDYGYTLSWDSSWTVQSAKASKGGSNGAGFDQLVLDNGTSGVTITGAEGFGGDATACISGVSAQIQSTSGISNFHVGQDTNGHDIQGGNATDSFAVYVYDAKGPNGQTATVANYVECQRLVAGKAVLVIVQEVLASNYTSQIPARTKLLDTIKLPHAAGTPTAGTPVAATPAAGTPTSGR